jgi:hypothetical protein
VRNRIASVLAAALDARPRAYAAACGLAALLFVTASVGPAAAQPGDLSGFGFLRLEPSARAAALGGSFSAVYGDDVNALFYNPALLNEETHRALSLSYLNHLAGLNAGFVAYSRHLDGLGTVGGGLRFLSWGELQGADENGERTGTFGASDVALTVGFARPVNDQFRYGVNLHGIFSSIDAYDAAALAFDAGLVYHLPGPQLTVSASVNNAGTTLQSFGPTQDELPLDVRLGVAKRLRYVPLLVSVTGYNLHDPGDAPDGTPAASRVMRHVAVGGEFQFSEAFNIRFGYNHRRHEELKLKSRLDLAGLGLGFGLKVSRLRVDYAFNSWSSLGGLHQFTVRTTI